MTPTYEDILKQSKLSAELNFVASSEHSLPASSARKRRRNILWFNPPFNLSLNQNFGKQFFRILDDSFPVEHKFRHLFNRNTVKLSYSCTPNVKTIISGHNKKLLEKGDLSEEEPKMCNCRGGEQSCPLDGQCKTSSVVYAATVETPGEPKQEYVGVTGQTFKQRYSSHKYDLTHKKVDAGTALSQYVWSMRDKGKEPTVRWRILDKGKAYQPGSNGCALCLTEKYRILMADRTTSLNKRSELVAKCRHSAKFKLEAVT